MVKLAAVLKAKEEAAKAEAERIRLEQIAQRQAAEQLAKFNAMVAAEKEARIKKAAETATEALSLYHQGKFPEAKAKFEEATKLDPANKTYYYQYAVSLYRTEDFNKAVVFFNLAQGDGVDQTEKNFFLGLAYFRLKNYENSLGSFERVIATKHKDMAPSASFYKGIILFDQKKWAEAQAAFQAVLDTSKDNALDERAEAYVERILRIQQFELERSRKWQFTFMAGEQLDSNVLLQPDSLAAPSSTGKEGYRTLLMGSGRYRPIYDETTEFAIQLDALTMYTVDRTYQVAQSLRNADPTVAALTLPWAHKGLLFGKGYKLDVIPGYESTWMSIEDNTNKVILASTTLAVNNLLVMRDNWFANYNVEFRNDQSQLKSSIGDDNSNAFKAKFAFNNLIFVSDDKAKIVTANAAYTQNQAVGKNNIFNRVDLAIGYIQPTVWDMSFNTSLAYYLLNYPQKATPRLDNDYTLNVGLNKKITDTWSTGVTGAYTINGSTDESSKYSKYTIMLTLSALTAF
jgi:tetratricopeptide (TPR) repeat protein